MTMDQTSALRLGLHLNKVISAFPEIQWKYALSPEQIKSKVWLIETLKKNKVLTLGRVLVLGGWVGLLSYLFLADNSFNINCIRSLDKDPLVLDVADELNKDFLTNDWKFKSGFGDWDQLNYESTLYSTRRYEDKQTVELNTRFDTIINTCCEHMLNYSEWLSKIPSDRLLILQSNSYFGFDGHVNCHSSLDDFVQKTKLKNLLYMEQLDLGLYSRWMIAGYR